jgi:hypothetical protein
MLSLHRLTSNSSPTTNFPWHYPTKNWLVAPIVFKITPLHRPHGKHLLLVKDACLQLRCLATDILLFRAFASHGPHRKHSFPYIVLTGSHIETAVLLLPLSVAVRMFTDIPPLLHNIATGCLPRICLRGYLFTNTMCWHVTILIQESYLLYDIWFQRKPFLIRINTNKTWNGNM